MRRGLPRIPATRAVQAGVLVAALLLLAACSGMPEQDTPEQDAAPAAIGAAATPADAPPVSPYAPAQEDLSKRGNYTAGGLYAPGIRDSAPDELPRVDLIPEPVPRAEPRSRYGNRSPYTVLGKQYRVMDNAQGYVDRGIASYYGQKFHGRRTSSLEVYDMYTFSAAHKSLPLPSYARVTNLENGRSVVVRVNDRGPFHAGRIIDLSYAAAVKLDVHRSGTAQVEVRALSPGEDPRHLPSDTAIAQAPATATTTTTSATVPAASATAPVLPPGARIATGQSRPTSAMDTLVAALPDAPVAATATTATATPATSVVSPQPQATASVTVPAAGNGWRFDMHQDGRTMTADEFDAWMRTRGARVATGVPGKPTIARAAATAGTTAAMTIATADANAVALATAKPPTGNSLPATASPIPAAPDAPVVVATHSVASPVADAVILQVASFAGYDNAQRALAMMRGAGIDDARLFDAIANGRPVWRLRIGPVDGAAAADLAARVVGLGFGPPQVLRDR